ncbi:hypothetical protein FOTG_06819 [Fusarium oxysporum f. sp. vasinfectum 25433]|uniref:Uncharacterized protein n=1 Tax=Fusarium oxysporum f. sp. vasinfectum 25433 TaxID=1089449 RepID=X0LKU4_FUSOX|nr:hypothetical protein FOTG_06819 [Fusarium oxysporum f. sp. vasinfectum 25433]
MSSSEIELTAGELKELIEMNIKALYAFDKVRLFLVKRIEEASGRVLYGAGVATFPSTAETEIFLRSSGRRFTIESALEDILEQTMVKLSKEMLFPEWCVKVLNDYLSGKSGLLHITFPIMNAGKREKATDEAFAIGQPAKVAFACGFKGKRLAVAKRGILQLGYPQV